MTDQKTQNHDFARSRSNAGLGLLDRINAHLRQLAPHMMQRDGVVLLREARDELLRMNKPRGCGHDVDAYYRD